jgi:hypothetical protein
MAQLQGQLSAVVMNQLQSTEVSEMTSSVLEEWCHAMSFGRWLELKGRCFALTLQQLVSSIDRSYTH